MNEKSLCGGKHKTGEGAGKIQNKGNQFKVLGAKGGGKGTREGRGMDKSIG